jgi:uncharacterized protein
MIRLLLALSLTGIPLAATSGAASDEHPDRRAVLTVSAMGTERVGATVADVRLAIEERGLTDEEARTRMARRSNQLLEYLRGADVTRLETTSLRLHPIYDYTKGDREVVGFQAMSVVRFRADAARVGHIIDESIARGANQVQDLVFTAPETEIEAARQRALRAATRIALQRADAVLDELGLERRAIVRVQVEAVEPDPPVFPQRRAEARALATADRPPLDVGGGDPAVNASVTIEIAY